MFYTIGFLNKRYYYYYKCKIKRVLFVQSLLKIFLFVPACQRTSKFLATNFHISLYYLQYTALVIAFQLVHVNSNIQL